MSEKEPNPRIIFEGKDLEALPSDTVAAALLRQKITVFTRGPKYHRPRGPFCLAGNCAQCHMRVDGEADVPTCVEPVRDGMRVERQNALGSADSDLLRAIDFVFRDGIDHHHLMTRFKTLTSATQAVARRLAGVGEKPSKELDVRPARVDERDLVIIGAGPAGLAAAAIAARHGIDALVLESGDEPGGHVLEGYSNDPAITVDSMHKLADEAARRAELAFRARAVAISEEGGKRLILALRPSGLWIISAKHVVLATGGIERPFPFEANDLPGVFAGRGLVRLARRHHVRAGKAAVVVGSTPDAILVARSLGDAGTKIVGIIDAPGLLPETKEFTIWRENSLIRATGTKKVEGVVLRDREGTVRKIACDVVAVTLALQPAFELAAQVGARTEWRPESGGFILVLDSFARTSVSWMMAAGGVTGDVVPPLLGGELAGLSAVTALHPDDATLDPPLQLLRSRRESAITRADKI